MHKVAHDREFLTETLQETIKVDDFTRRLFDIFVKVWDEGLEQVGNIQRTFWHVLSKLKSTSWLLHF